MSNEHASSQTITTRVDVGWAKLVCEVDPKSLAREMSHLLALAGFNSCPDANDVISDPVKPISRRGASIFFEKLPDEIAMCMGGLLTKAVKAACEEVNTRTLSVGASSHTVNNINSQLNNLIESALISGHRSLWGEPEIGRPPKSAYERNVEWETKRTLLISRYTSAIDTLIKTDQPRKKVLIARLAYSQAAKTSRPVLLAQDTKKYEINLKSLIADAEKEEKEKS
jgi:hypothetical protein